MWPLVGAISGAVFFGALIMLGYSFFKKNGMIKVWTYVLIACCVLFITAIVNTPVDSPKEQSKPTAQDKPATSEQLSKIHVTFDVQDLVTQDGKIKVVVFMKNTSDKTFSGTVKVNSLDVDGKSLGFDAIYPENIGPGKSSYAITWFKVGSPPKFRYEVLSGEFK